MPSSAVLRLKNACGVCTRMPAPSPAQRVGADRAAVFEVAQDVDRVLDDLVRLAALDVGDEADAAGILLDGGDRRGRWLPARRARAGRCRSGIFHGPLRRRSELHSHMVEPLRAHRLPRYFGRPSSALVRPAHLPCSQRLTEPPRKFQAILGDGAAFEAAHRPLTGPLCSCVTLQLVFGSRPRRSIGTAMLS